VTFQTKNELTLEMGRAVVESGALRCRWFLADEAFGRDTVLLDAVDGLGLWYMVEVPLDTHIWRADASAATTPKALFPTLNGRAWSREEIGEGTKGPRASQRCTCGGCVPSARGTPARKSGCSCALTPKAVSRKPFCPTRRRR
jgi:SRSO17 transposase